LKPRTTAPLPAIHHSYTTKTTYFYQSFPSIVPLQLDILKLFSINWKNVAFENSFLPVAIMELAQVEHPAWMN